jgi:hypothetical protein
MEASGNRGFFPSMLVFLLKITYNCGYKLKGRLKMQASKVIISQETREKLNNQALSPLKKRELREQMVIAAIRKAVGGTRTKQELIAAAGYNPAGTSPDYARGLGFLTGMVNRGLITHNDTNTFKKNWTVLADVKTTKAKDPEIMPTAVEIAKAIVAPEEEKAPEVVVELKEKTHVNKGTLINLAKEFAWKHNSDSLREFIAFADNRLK